MKTTGHHRLRHPWAASLLGGLLVLVGCGPSVTVLESSGDGCDAGLTPCGQSCVDLQNDPHNCGGCGSSCGPDEHCIGGTCSSDGCPPGLSDCGGQCVDLGTNPQHCGGCYHLCDFDESCLAGACVGGACPPGLLLCGDECVDTLVDPMHCGGCTNSCGSGESCNYGSCTCSNPVCGICGVEDIGSTVPQTKTGTGSKNEKEPSCAAPGSPEKIYSFTAPTTGGYQLSTAGSSYDTTLYLLDQGCAELACNDDTSYDLTSLLDVELAGGQQVLVVVDGFGGDYGSFVLNITSAPTPVCPMHDLGSLSPQTVSGSTLGQPSTEEGYCGGYGGPEVSYSFTAPATGSYVFHTDGSQYDTVLHVRDGSCTGPEIACNDDQIGLNSLVYLSLAQGQTVILFVDSFDTMGGPYNLSVFGPF